MAGAVKQQVMRALRDLRLLETAGFVQFLRRRMQSALPNRLFRRDHPDVAVPPAWLMFDAYGHTDYRKYAAHGRAAAAFVASRIAAHAPDRPLRILEWGCGPARVIRHLHEASAVPVERLVGADYNRRSIDWCRRHLDGIEFVANDLTPPLPQPAASFDAIYALSVFTHLSEAMHHAWIAELRRLLAPGGLLLASFHGGASAAKLTPGERARFEAGELVVRAKVLEGSLLFTAFQPESFLRDCLFAGFDVLETIETAGPLFGQDLWIVRKQ